MSDDHDDGTPGESEPEASSAVGRRTSARRRIRERVRVRLTETRADFGRVLDLSRRGLRVEHDSALRVGAVFDLLVECDAGEDTPHPVRIAGQVRWCEPGAVPGSFECGLQIKAMVSRDAAVLEALYDRLAAGAATLS